MVTEVKTHKDLEVWKQSIDLVTDIYRITEGFPKNEGFGLTSQIRRASVSVPANISEGAARNSTKEFIQFLYIGLGSLSELETLLIISENLRFIQSEPFLNRITALRKMLIRLIQSLRR
ncbi:MAG: four helix bundle protein [Thermodesulfobacteriota bacterium]|nr:four helix bundle protein [Thermodesulfobacteriota bacterium]